MCLQRGIEAAVSVSPYIKVLIIIAHSDTESTNCGFPTKHERAPARLFRGVSEALAVLHHD